VTGEGTALYARGVLHLEFTVEPFVEGQPGPHVLAAVSAVEEAGCTVDFGPFGSSCAVPTDSVGRVVGALLDAAYRHGATHVSVHVAPEPAL
jgi:uncharacterized protein YqgV (UPF0045/DUF77 family)